LATNKKIYDAIDYIDNVQEREIQIKKALTQYLNDIPQIMKGGKTNEEIIDETLKQVANPWVAYFLRYDPAPALEKVKCPVLAVNGSKDMQVPSEINLAAIGKTLEKGENKNFTLKEFDGLNHLFQESKTGSPMEYSIIKQTFSPAVLEEIGDWIRDVVEK
jgi:pimeloyl-ACP methyl ester carboxylesterase